MRSLRLGQQKSAFPIFLIALTLSGCMGTLPPPEPPEFANTTLTVACPDELKELIQVRSRPWVARQQAVVVSRSLPRDGAESADIDILAPAEMPARAAKGELLALPRSLIEDRPFDWTGLLPQYRELLLVWGTEPFALPLVGESPLCVYRADLYDKHKTEYRAWQAKRNNLRSELTAPSTWDEFADQAEFFREKYDRPSLPALPLEDVELDRWFYSIASSHARRAVNDNELQGPDHREEVFSFHYDLTDQCKPRIASPGFVASLELLQRLQRCRPRQASATPEVDFMEGRAVLCLTDASWVARFQGRPEIRDRLGICPVPGSSRFYSAKKQWQRVTGVNRVPYLGSSGWLIAVRASSKQQNAALDLLKELAGPSASLQTAMEPRWGGPIRAEQVLRERWDAFDLDAKQTRALRDSVKRTLLQHGIKNPVGCLRLPNQSAHRTILLRELRSCLNEGTPADKALEKVSKEWDDLDKGVGVEAHRRAYRMSLGLSGRE